MRLFIGNITGKNRGSVVKACAFEYWESDSFSTIFQPSQKGEASKKRGGKNLSISFAKELRSGSCISWLSRYLELNDIWICEAGRAMSVCWINWSIAISFIPEKFCVSSEIYKIRERIFYTLLLTKKTQTSSTFQHFSYYWKSFSNRTQSACVHYITRQRNEKRFITFHIDIIHILSFCRELREECKKKWIKRIFWFGHTKKESRDTSRV